MTRSELIQMVEDHLVAARRAKTRWSTAGFSDSCQWEGSPGVTVAHACASLAVLELICVRDLAATCDLVQCSVEEIVRTILTERPHTPAMLAHRLFGRMTWIHTDWLCGQMVQLEAQGVVQSDADPQGRLVWTLGDRVVS